MKKTSFVLPVLMSVGLLFTACGADLGDNTKDGFIGGNPGTISATDRTAESGRMKGTKSVGERIRDEVKTYYKTREGLYGDIAYGTWGNSYAKGDFLYGTSNTQLSPGGVVRNDMDTNANIISNQNGSTEVTDPIAPGGLVQNGSDNME